MIAHAHHSKECHNSNQEELSETLFSAVSRESLKFLRPRLILTVVLDFTHYALVYTFAPFLTLCSAA